MIRELADELNLSVETIIHQNEFLSNIITTTVNNAVEAHVITKP